MSTNLIYGIRLSAWVEGLEVDADSVTLQGDDGGGFDPIPADEYRIHSVLGAIAMRQKDSDSPANEVDWDAFTGTNKVKVTTYTLYNPTSGTLGGIAAGGTLDVTNELHTLDYLTLGVATNDDEAPVATTPPVGMKITASEFNHTIKSDNFVAGVSGWRIKRSGVAEFEQVTVRGTVYASAGVIGGLTLASSTLTATNLVIDSGNQEIRLGSGNDIIVLDAADATYRIWVGHATAGSATFRVTKGGALTATGATISGTLTATAGTIGGFTLASTTLTATNLVLDSGNQEIRLGSSNDIIVLDAADATYRIWVGHASPGSATFNVTKAGVLTASGATISGAITATSGTFSGNVLITGTLQSSATANLGYKLNSTGFRTWNSGNTQTAQILADGSGWLGSSSVFSWNTSGVVQMNGSAVVSNSLDADKVTFTAPVISGLTLTNNSPGAGSVAWSSCKLTYKGVSYTISSGSTSNRYIYWKASVSTSTFQTAAAGSIPAQAADTFIVALNFSGTAHMTSITPFVYADYISVGTLSAIVADMGSITAGTVTGATIRTAASGTRTEMNSTGIHGYNSGGTVQWESDSSTGKFKFGGGAQTLGSDGFVIAAASGFSSGTSIRWRDGSVSADVVSLYVETQGGVIDTTFFLAVTPPASTDGYLQITCGGTNGGNVSIGTNNRSVEIDNGNGIYLHAPTITSDGNIEVDGRVNVTGQYRVDNVRVVTNQQTGWSAATGTATRTSFATGSVSTANLAERVKALIDDLLTHGLIGA